MEIPRLSQALVILAELSVLTGLGLMSAVLALKMKKVGRGKKAEGRHDAVQCRSACLHAQSDPYPPLAQGYRLISSDIIPILNVTFGAACTIHLLITCILFYGRVILANRSGKQW